MNYTSILEEMVDTILNSTVKLIGKAKFDKSFNAKVIEDRGNGRYVIIHNNKNYTAHGYRENINVGDYVMVCVPQNNWNNLYIV